MRKLKFIISLVTCSFALYSQTDTLVTVNEKKVPVSITEITDKDVIYKIPSKPDVPLLHFSRNNLQDIILKDGSSINPKFKTVNPYDKPAITRGKSIIYFTVSKLFQNHIGFAYEHISKDNIIGIRIPVSVAFIDPAKANLQGAYLYKTDNKRYYTVGIDVNFYPLKLGKFRYVVGFGIQYAQFAYQQYYYDYSTHLSSFTNEKGNHYSFVINNGFFSQLSKHFVMSGSTGFGLQFEEYKTNNYYNYNQYNNTSGQHIRINATFNVGYLF